jgi:hypothetical protein
MRKLAWRSLQQRANEHDGVAVNFVENIGPEISTITCDVESFAGNWVGSNPFMPSAAGEV